MQRVDKIIVPAPIVREIMGLTHAGLATAHENGLIPSRELLSIAAAAAADIRRAIGPGALASTTPAGIAAYIEHAANADDESHHQEADA